MTRKLIEPSKKLLSEADTRKNLVKQACEFYGPDAGIQLQMAFDKWDKALFKCTNKVEREHIQVLANVEIYRMMGYSEGLEVDGKVIITPEGSGEA